MRTLSKISLWVLLIFGGALLATGCGGDEPAAAPPGGPQAGSTVAKPGPKKPKAAPKTPEAEAAVLAETVRDWKYDPTGKWDPFLKPEAPVILNDGEGNYDLDQMLLLGVVMASRESMSAAYIRMPNGKDKIVQIGDIIGKHGGEVKEIGKDYILVEEKYMDPQHPNDTFIIEKELKLLQKAKK